MNIFKKLRILHVVPTYLPATRYGGPIYSVHGLCRALAAQGHEVHVFTTNVDGPQDSDVPLRVPVDLEGVRVWYFPSRRLRRLYWSPPLARALKAEISGFDVVHLHSIYLWPTWAAAKAGRRAGVPYVLAPRGMLVKDLVARKSRWLKSLWLALIERGNIEHASALHLTSSLEDTEARKFGFRLPPVHIVPNGVEPIQADYSLTQLSQTVRDVLNQRQPFLLFLSRINWKKGLDRLISALQFVPDIYLVIAGNDEENYQVTLNSMVQSHGLNERIAFIGPVEGADKAALLEKAKAMVLPSYSENFGNVVLEAMAAGCPVVVTPEVGLSTVIRDTGSGLVVEGKPEVLGEALVSLLENPAQRSQMRQCGLRLVEDRFTWKAVSTDMEKVYQEIVEENNDQNKKLMSV